MNLCLASKTDEIRIKMTEKGSHDRLTIDYSYDPPELRIDLFEWTFEKRAYYDENEHGIYTITHPRTFSTLVVDNNRKL